jgi:hypothetical protein
MGPFDGVNCPGIVHSRIFSKAAGVYGQSYIKPAVVSGSKDNIASEGVCLAADKTGITQRGNIDYIGSQQGYGAINVSNS